MTAASRDFWELYAGGAACTLALLRAGVVEGLAAETAREIVGLEALLDALLGRA